MEADALGQICYDSLAAGRYVYLVHRGIGRDVYPFGIRGERLYCWCSIHPDREVEGMYLDNISAAVRSENEVGMLFPRSSDFEPSG